MYRGHAKYVSYAVFSLLRTQQSVFFRRHIHRQAAYVHELFFSFIALALQSPTCISLGCQESKICAYLPDLEDPLFMLEGHADPGQVWDPCVREPGHHREGVGGEEGEPVLAGTHCRSMSHRA